MNHWQQGSMPWTSTAAICIYSFPVWQVANEIAKPQVSIHSNNSSIYCKKSNRKWKWKFATGNRK